MLNSKGDRVVTFMIRLCCVRPYLNRLEQETPLLALQKYAAMFLRRPIEETMWQWTLGSLHELRVVLNWWPASKWEPQSVLKWILLTTWMNWKIIPQSGLLMWMQPGWHVDHRLLKLWAEESAKPGQTYRKCKRIWPTEIVRQ